MTANTSNLRTLIVDDEQLAREELIFMLKKYPEIEIIGEAPNAKQAIKLINELEPDLIFLDVNMPEKSGFDLLDELVNAPKTVFVTAYDEFALKAFDKNAIDYIVKPVNPLRLKQAIDKVSEYTKEQNLKTINNKAIATSVSMKNIFIKDGNNCYFIRLTDIHYIKSNGNYCEIYFNTNKAVIHKSLNQMEERLPDTQFFRANRQEIFNIDYITDVDILLRNVIQITLNTGKLIELSNRQSIKFKDLMSI